MIQRAAHRLCPQLLSMPSLIVSKRRQDPVADDMIRRKGGDAASCCMMCRSCCIDGYPVQLEDCTTSYNLERVAGLHSLMKAVQRS